MWTSNARTLANANAFGFCLCFPFETEFIPQEYWVLTQVSNFIAKNYTKL